ncbi:MAG: hypothetical protein ABSH08_08385 [Tepidisphaeraceae bacterium]|jgi:hypothetical protein
MDWDELTGLVDGSAMPLADNRDRVEITSVIAVTKPVDTRLFSRIEEPKCGETMARFTLFLSPGIACLFATLTLRPPATLRAQEPITITPDWTTPPLPIPADYSGLSFETQLVLPNAHGVHYFRPDNDVLVAMFKTLGIKHLRIGGNTSDNTTVAIPGKADIDSLFAFAHAAGVKVIYSVRLKGQSDASGAIPIVKYIQENYGGDLDCFALGNEPSNYYKEYSTYKKVWEKLTDQIVAAVPKAVFCGPNTDRPHAWAVQFAQDFGGSGRVSEVSVHAYVGLNARDVTDVAAARDKMLSGAWVKLYQSIGDEFIPVLADKRLRYRVEETNSFYNGGREGVSDTFAAALWALDYLHWWSRHRASGIDFHTGDNVAAGPDSTPCRYAAYVSTVTGYDVRPVGYAIKAFDLAGHGSMIHLACQSAPDFNVTAYGEVASDNTLYITVINKEHGPAGRDAAVTTDAGKAYLHGEVQFLANDRHDIAGKTGITLGGAPIRDDASWAGKWSPLQAPAQAGQFTITVPAATAAIIKLTEN